MCTRPIQGYRHPDGAVRFAKPGGNDDPLSINCGKCIECRQERALEWTKRLMAENRMHDASCFVTLTYDEKNLPFDLSLDVRDWQLFAGRLRKRIGKFRYYQCGEYGDETDRPHHHALIFGWDFRRDRQLYRATPHGNLYTSPTLDAAWGKGYAPFGDVTPQSCRYVAGYITKKLWGDQARDAYASAWQPNLETGEIEPCMWRKPPFSTMSLKPGIGTAYVEKYGREVFSHDQFLELDNKPLRPPKFFDKWLEEHDPERLESYQHERKQRADRYHLDRRRNDERERVHKHRIKQERQRDPTSHTAYHPG